MRALLVALPLLLPSDAFAGWHSVLQVSVGTPSHSIAVSSIGSGCSTGSTCAISGTYTGTAPSGSGWSGTWNSALSGSSTITITGSPSGGTWSGTATTPASGGTGTLTVTDNLSDSATSGSVTIGSGAYSGWYESYGNQAFTAYGGLRCYSAAQASAAQAIRLRLGSNTQQDIGLTAACAIDQAAAISFGTANADATCTGSISGTTLTVPSCASGTLHALDTITGTGLTHPPYIVTIGGCATPPGSCTISTSQTFSTGTITALPAMYGAKVYDQTGNGHDWVQATNGNQLYFIVDRGDGISGFLDTGGLYLTTPSFTLSQPFTWVTTVSTDHIGSLSVIMASDGPTTYLAGTTTSNTYEMYAGTSQDTTAANSASHVMQSVFNGTSSKLNIDDVGTPVGSVNAGTQGMSGTFEIAAYTGILTIAGVIYEWGVVPVAPSAATQTSGCHNAHLAWNTPTSC